jgi:hypothetical protein
MKDLIFQKGGIGRALNRTDSISRLNPVLRTHHELNYTYDAAIARLDGGEIAGRLSALQRYARADAGKISESVLSLGGVPESGVDMEPNSFDAGSNHNEIIDRLIDLESRFIDDIDAESKVDHQMRTRAILSATRKNARERLDYLKSVKND